MAELLSMSEEEVRERTRALLDEVHPERVDSITFRRKQYEHGLAWVHFPEGYGGLGISPKMNVVVLDEISDRLCYSFWRETMQRPRTGSKPHDHSPSSLRASGGHG